MIRLHDAFKVQQIKLPGIRFEELQANAADAGYSVLCDINGTWFKAHVTSEAVSRCYGDERALMNLIGSPIRALQKLFRDGIAEGRELERKEEIRMLRTKQENAYRALRHKAMADAWTAIAKGNSDAK